MSIDWLSFLLGASLSFVFEILVGIFITGRVVQWYLTKNAKKILYAILQNMSDEDKKMIRQWLLGMFGNMGGRPGKLNLMSLASQFLPLLLGGQRPPTQPPIQPPISEL